MTRNYCYILFTFSIGLILTSCKKKDKNLEADITILNAEDDTPVSGAHVIYEYQSESSSTVIKEEVGTTDDDGKFHFSRKIPRSDANTKLRVFADGYENPYSNGIEFDITAGFDNTEERKVYPSYHFSFSLTNVACLGATDSIWVSDIYNVQPYPMLFTGCVDTTLSFMGRPFTEWSLIKNRTFSYTVKRNGVTTTNQLQVTMQLNQITPVHITY